MRPCASVSGTRGTRCAPASHLNTEYAPSPLTAKTTSLKPPASLPLASSCSTVKPRRSADRVSIRKTAAAQSAAAARANIDAHVLAVGGVALDQRELELVLERD